MVHSTNGVNQPFLCFGEYLIDSLPEGDRAGGAPVNVACHLSRLGSEAVPVTAIGSDSDGEFLREHLKACGLTDVHVQERSHRATGRVVVRRDRSGEPEYEIRENAAWDEIRLEHHTVRLAREGAGLVFGTLALRSEMNRETLRALHAVTAGPKVFDVNFRSPYDETELVEEFAPGVDILKMNRAELLRLAGLPGESGTEDPSDVSDLFGHVRRVGRRFDAGCTVTTLGAGGAILWDGDMVHVSPRSDVAAVDPVGAGDAFLAGLLDGFYRLKLSAPDALARADRLGAFVASRVGAVPEYSAGLFD